MKRREALQSIAIIAAGMTLLPACDFEEWPTFSKIPLEKPQKNLIKWLTQSIIPKPEQPLVTTPEPTHHFVLTMVNDCYETEDTEKYVSGMNALVTQLSETKKVSVKSLKPEESDKLIVELIGDESLDENIRFFLSATRRHTIQHFTSSEYFMTNHLNFEFIPGRFNGCFSA